MNAAAGEEMDPEGSGALSMQHGCRTGVAPVTAGVRSPDMLVVCRVDAAAAVQASKWPVPVPGAWCLPARQGECVCKCERSQAAAVVAAALAWGQRQGSEWQWCTPGSCCNCASCGTASDSRILCCGGYC